MGVVLVPLRPDLVSPSPRRRRARARTGRLGGCGQGGGRRGRRRADRARRRGRRTSARSGNKPTTLWTWPPASTPCTISASAPASAAALAASAEATCTSTRAPPTRAWLTRSGRSPNENDTHGTLSSTTSARRSSCAKSSTRFTQNGRSVTRAIERICSRSSGGSVHDAPSVPRPPARETAVASCAAAPRPSGACISGNSQPSTLTARSVRPRCRAGQRGSARRPRAACHAPIRSRRRHTRSHRAGSRLRLDQRDRLKHPAAPSVRARTSSFAGVPGAAPETTASKTDKEQRSRQGRIGDSCSRAHRGAHRSRSRFLGRFW